MLSHRDVGWDTVAAGLAISFVTFVSIPRISPPIASLLIGSICALIGILIDSPLRFGFGPEIFFYIMLPPIILRSGLEFEWDSVRPVWRSTLLFALFGTVFSAFVIYVGCDLCTDLTTHQCMTIGSVLSSTDPTATVTSIKHSNMPQMMKNAMEGEALTNDAVAAMLAHATEKQKWSTSDTVLEVIVGVITSISIGSVGGYMFGGFENPITTMGMATALFACCELLKASGILCIFLFAITSKWRRTSSKMESFVDILADVADIYCMFAVGTEIIYIDASAFQASIIIFMSSVAARVVSIVGLGLLSFEGWQFNQLMFMGLTGARGTLSYALARSMGMHIGPIVLCVVILSTLSTGIFTFLIHKY